MLTAFTSCQQWMALIEICAQGDYVNSRTPTYLGVVSWQGWWLGAGRRPSLKGFSSSAANPPPTNLFQSKPGKILSADIQLVAQLDFDLYNSTSQEQRNMTKRCASLYVNLKDKKRKGTKPPSFLGTTPNLQISQKLQLLPLTKID